MYRKIGSNREKNRGFTSSDEKIKFLLNSLKKEYNVSTVDLINILREELTAKEVEKIIVTPELIKRLRDKKLVPVSVFNKKLSALETIIKFLKENLGISIKEIASLTNRSPKTIWQACNSSKKKHEKPFSIEISDYYIPISILKGRKFSVLESIVVYLKDLGLTYHEIAVLLHRDDRTIWTVYNRSKIKSNASR